MVREMFSAEEFLEVFIDTPIEDCIARDPKGLYAKALDGQIANFTGINSPYEPPEDAEVVVPTRERTAAEAAEAIVVELDRRGLL